MEPQVTGGAGIGAACVVLSVPIVHSSHYLINSSQKAVLCAPSSDPTQACPARYLACGQSTPITVGIQPLPVTIVQGTAAPPPSDVRIECEHEATEGWLSTDDDHRTTTQYVVD